MALKARPEVHKQKMLKPFFRTGEYCATCHKVSVDTRANNYRVAQGRGAVRRRELGRQQLGRQQ